jgi:hypothetical protein
MFGAGRRKGDEASPARDLQAQAAALIGENAALLDRLAGDPYSDRLIGELVINGITVRGLTEALQDSAGGEVCMAAAYDRGLEDGRAQSAARPRGPRGKHAAAREGAWLRLVPPGGVGAAFGRPAKHRADCRRSPGLAAVLGGR